MIIEGWMTLCQEKNSSNFFPNSVCLKSKFIVNAQRAEFRAELRKIVSFKYISLYRLFAPVKMKIFQFYCSFAIGRSRSRNIDPWRDIKLDKFKIFHHFSNEESSFEIDTGSLKKSFALEKTWKTPQKFVFR